VGDGDALGGEAGERPRGPEPRPRDVQEGRGVVPQAGEGPQETRELARLESGERGGGAGERPAAGGTALASRRPQWVEKSGSVLMRMKQIKGTHSQNVVGTFFE